MQIGLEVCVKVLSARFGLEGVGGWFLDKKVKNLGSSVINAWWKLGFGMGLIGSLFRQNLRFLIGKGDRTLSGKIYGLERDLLKTFFQEILEFRGMLMLWYKTWSNMRTGRYPGT